MKIVLLCTQLEAGGAQNASIRLAKKLRDDNHRTENWFLYKKRDAFFDTPNIVNILERPIKSSIDYIRISYLLFRKYRKEKPDIVVTFTHYANVLGLIVAFFSGVKIRIASHRNPSWGDMSKALMSIDKLCAVTGIYTAITAVSESTKKTFNYYPPQIYNSIKVIKNGLNFNKSLLSKAEARTSLKLPADKVLIGTIGRLSRQKNQSLLIQAIKNLNVHLVIVGEGELKSELVEIVDSIKVNDRVHILGEISGDKIPLFLKSLDIYVMPSLFEGLSNALVEALYAGVPILSSDIPAQQDVIISDDGTVNGILLPTDDPQAWADAIEKLLTIPELYDYYSERSLIRAEDFSIENMTLGFKNVMNI